jgi:DNA-binding HxlR family transcriptional regulator
MLADYRQTESGQVPLLRRNQDAKQIQKMLTLHLREMEQDGIVVRSDLSGRRRHVEYSLETSLGAAVLHLIGTLTEWGSQYAPTHSRQGPVREWPEK